MSDGLISSLRDGYETAPLIRDAIFTPVSQQALALSAVETFGQAVSSLHAAGNLTDELGATVVLADMWLARGRPAHAGALLERALAGAVARPGPALSVTGDLQVGLADVCRELGDLVGAEEHLQAARDLVSTRRCPRTATAGTPSARRCRWRAVT